MASGAGASALVVPGLAAADSESNGRGDELRTSPEIRARKAKKEGKEWNEDWLDTDRIDETWTDLEAEVTAQDERRIGGEFGVKGITVTVEAYFGECEGWVEIGALGQTRRITLTCSEVCGSRRIDGGAAYLDFEACYNWDNQTLSLEAEGCVWHLTDWSCATVNKTY